MQERLEEMFCLVVGLALLCTQPLYLAHDLGKLLL